MGELITLTLKEATVGALHAAATAYVEECQRNGLRTSAAVTYAARQFGVSESTIWRWREAYVAERIARNFRQRQGAQA